MIQSEIPFSSIFKDTSILLQNQRYLTTIISLDKNLIGVCNSFNVDNEIKIYQFMSGKWGEYLNKYIKNYGRLNLVCFNNDNNQLLLYKSHTDSIEYFTIKKTKQLKLYNDVDGRLKCFSKFLRNKQIVTMIPSDNQQYILIRIDFHQLLFDINQKTIIKKFESESQNLYNKFQFYDNHYLMNICISFDNKLKSLQFYQIDGQNKTKMIKMLCLKILHESITQQLNNCRCIAFTGMQDQLGYKNFEMLGSNGHFGTLLNIINLKLIRKIILMQDYASFFIGLIQQYLLLYSIDNLSNKSQQKVDLFSFQMEISKFNKSCFYQNQILRIQSKHQQQCQLLIRK